VKELKVVLKADVQGSLEAVGEALRKLATNDVRLAVIHGSVGGITESDVLLASASNAIIIGFNVRPEPKAAALAEREGVDVRLYTIIYEAVADVRPWKACSIDLPQQTQARVDVRQIFTSRACTIAGCYVTEGKIARGNLVRVLRDQVVVHEGKLGSLKRFKDDVREVAAGYECGLSLEGYQDLKQGDVIEAFERIPVMRRIAPAQSGREGARVSGA
jgi:translation initiation factor IF-2